MPRIIVTTDPPQLVENASVLLDESVHSIHLSTGHAAAQLVERLAWAISDAEDAERGHTEPTDHRDRLEHLEQIDRIDAGARRASRRRSAARTRVLQPVSA